MGQAPEPDVMMAPLALADRPLRRLLLGAVPLAPALVGVNARAEGLPVRQVLPMALAIEAAGAAITHCAAEGHRVTAVVLDAAGTLQVVLRGDGASPYTYDSARMKAYTVASLGPIRRVDTTGDLARQILPDAAAAQLVNIPGMLLVPGGVALRNGNDLVAALGVAGAPAGTLDEGCAQAGAAAVRDRLQPAGGRP